MSQPLHKTYPGLHADRLHPKADNPREVAFAQLWEEVNDPKSCVTPVLAAITAPSLSSGRPDRNYAPSDASKAVAATVIQWLGSNMGMTFLAGVVKREPRVMEYLRGTVDDPDPTAAPSVTDYDPLVPLCHIHLLNLAGTAMQPKLHADDTAVLAVRHAKLLSFFSAEPAGLRTTSMEYQAVIDYALALALDLRDHDMVRFLAHVGHPLTPEQFTAWFFSKP